MLKLPSWIYRSKYSNILQKMSHAAEKGNTAIVKIPIITPIIGRVLPTNLTIPENSHSIAGSVSTDNKLLLRTLCLSNLFPPI